MGEVGLRNLSKIAMTKNMEMRIAVATKPKETALTELSKLVQCSSLCGDSVGVGGHPLLCSSTAIDKYESTKYEILGRLVGFFLSVCVSIMLLTLLFGLDSVSDRKEREGEEEK